VLEVHGPASVCSWLCEELAGRREGRENGLVRFERTAVEF
jgi:hypothetical protein